jgi:multidrug efflux system membrane fusion protein
MKNFDSFKNPYFIGGSVMLVAIILWRIGASFLWEQHQQKVYSVPLAEVAYVIKKTVPYEITVPGNFVATQKINIYNRIDGEILTMPFKEGDIVKEGDILYTLNVKDQEAKFLQAQGSLEKNMALFEDARREFERNEKLVKQGFVSQSQMDQLKSIKNSLEASIKSDQGNIDYMKIQIGYATIKSPITGRIGFSNVDLGNLVKASNTALTAITSIPLTSVIKLDPIDFIFSVSEKYLDFFKKTSLDNMKVTLNDDHDHEKKTKGKIIALDNSISTTTGSLAIKARFENKDFEFWPGQFFNIKVVLEEKKDALIVPARAVQSGPHGPYVFLCNEADQTFSIREVKIGLSAEMWTMIESGLKEGDLVLVSGQNAFKNGTKATKLDKHDANALIEAKDGK